MALPTTIPLLYPGQIDTPSPLPPNMDDPPDQRAQLHWLFNAVQLLEQLLGPLPAGAHASIRNRLQAIESGAGITGLDITKLRKTVLGNYEFPGHIVTTGHLTVEGDVTVHGYTRMGDTGVPGLKFKEYAGQLNASGFQAVAHNIPDAPRRAISAGMVYKGNSGEAVDITVPNSVKFDGANLILDLGPTYAHRMWRGLLLFRETGWAW